MWLFSLLEEGQENVIAIDQVTPPLPNSEGSKLFNEACQFCHGRRGEGGHNGMPLEGLAAFSTSYVADIINNGRNNMPAFSSMYSNNQIRSIAEHVRTLNREIKNSNNR